MIWLVLLGSLIIIGLAGYAALLLRKLQQQKKQQQQRQAEAAQLHAKDQAERAESIRVIASAMCSMQCEIAEGTLRLAHLLQRMDGYEAWRESFPSISEMFEKIKHQPIGIARKDLPRKEVMRFDIERMKLESSYQEAILTEAQQLKTQFFALTGKYDEPVIAA